MDRDKYPVLRMFDGLEPEALDKLDFLQLKPKEALIQENGREPMSLYLILEGVCINDLVYQSTEYIFVARKVLPGEFIGLQELIMRVAHPDEPIRRVASVLAKTPVLAVEIPGDEFARWQAVHPQLYNQVIFDVLSRHFSERILNVNCAVKDSLMAGAYYLHYLYEAYAQGCHPKDYDGPVKIWDTRQEIGLALARNTRSVDRMINEFLRLGLIDVDRKKITITRAQAAQLLAFQMSRQ